MKIYTLFISAFLALFNPAFGATSQGSKNSLFYLSKTNPFKYSEMTDLFAFGDSYTTINADFDTMVTVKSDDVGIRNWPLYLAQKNPLKIWNFARAGAVVDHNILGSYLESPSMREQYDMFFRNMVNNQKFTKWGSDKSLATIWFGINDINNKYTVQENNISYSEIDKMIALSMFCMVEGLYKEGIRNFMFINVPPMEKFPMNSNISYDLKNEVMSYNEVISEHAKHFQYFHPDTNVLVYNANQEFYHIMENQSQYNISNVIDICPLDINEDCTETSHFTHFWRDYGHPTIGVEKIVANDMNEFLSNVEIVSENIVADKSCWSESRGTPCCTDSSVEVRYKNRYGLWGMENDNWCVIQNIESPSQQNDPENLTSKKDICWANSLGYKCCKTTNCQNVYYIDIDGEWGIEDHDWCIITPANTKC